MLSITIIAIVVVAVLTAIIFSLAWISYSSYIKLYKIEVETGKHDIEIFKEFYNCTKKDKRKQTIVKILGSTIVFMLLLAIICLFIVGVIYSSTEKNITIDNKTALVIKSGSMSKYYDDELALKYKELGYSEKLQFSIGDICIFETQSVEDTLVLGEVYGYKHQGIIITHRLIDVHNVLDSNGNIVKTYYIFKGDNNPSKDQILVSKDKILYHYTGNRVTAIGVIILYAQSTFGLWSLMCIIGIVISSDLILRKIHKITKERANFIGGISNEK